MNEPALTIRWDEVVQIIGGPTPDRYSLIALCAIAAGAGLQVTEIQELLECPEISPEQFATRMQAIVNSIPPVTEIAAEIIDLAAIRIRDIAQKTAGDRNAKETHHDC